MRYIFYVLIFIVSFQQWSVASYASETFENGEKVESPLYVDGAKTIDSIEAKNLFDKGVVFIDTRRTADWDAGRIPDAVHLELNSNLTEEAMLEVVGKDEPVVFYCNGFLCMKSSNGARKAVGWGFKKVYYFREGLPAWRQDNYLVE